MRGYNRKKLLPEIDLPQVTPLRYHILGKLLSAKRKAPKGLHLPDQAKEIQEHTSANRLEVVAFGDRVERSRTAEDLIHTGVEVAIDESISVDDPNRCFQSGGEVYVLFDVGSVVGVFTSPNHFKPLADRVLVEKDKPREEVRNGIIHLEWSYESLGGTVLEIGDGAYKDSGGRFPMDVKPGDRVLFPKHGHTDITIWDRDFVIIEQNKILGVLEKA